MHEKSSAKNGILSVVPQISADMLKTQANLSTTTLKRASVKQAELKPTGNLGGYFSWSSTGLPFENSSSY